MGLKIKKRSKRGCVRGCLKRVVRLGVLLVTVVLVLLLLMAIWDIDVGQSFRERLLSLLQRGRELGEKLIEENRKQSRDEAPDPIIVLAPTLTPPPAEPGPELARSTWNTVQRSLLTVKAAADEVSYNRDGTYQVEQEVGTGFVVDCDRYQVLVATAAHVVRNRTPEVLVAGGSVSVPADTLAIDETTDIALLRASTRALGTLAPLAISPSELPSGEVCWAVTTPAITRVSRPRAGGSALGKPRTVTSEMLSTYGLKRLSSSWFATTQETHKGFSGAPVVLASGNVVGVLVGGMEYENGRHISIAMGSSELRKLIQAASR